MAYIKTDWKARRGTGLNKFTETGRDGDTVNLTNTPDSVTEPGTPFSAENMNHIEQGIYEAHEAVSAEAQARQTADSGLQEQINTLTPEGLENLPALLAQKANNYEGNADKVKYAALMHNSGSESASRPPLSTDQPEVTLRYTQSAGNEYVINGFNTWMHILTAKHGGTGWANQLAMAFAGLDGVYYRSSLGDNKWGGWRQLAMFTSGVLITTASEGMENELSQTLGGRWRNITANINPKQAIDNLTNSGSGRADTSGQQTGFIAGLDALLPGSIITISAACNDRVTSLYSTTRGLLQETADVSFNSVTKQTPEERFYLQSVSPSTPYSWSSVFSGYINTYLREEE